MRNKFILFLCLFFIGAGITIAQDIELYRFTNTKLVDGNEMVLFHNISNNSISLIKKSSSDFNKKDGYLQSFILKRLEKGKVLIASAKQKKYFLKFNNTSNEIVFSTIENPEQLNEYTWQIQFAGTGKVLISPLNNPTKGLVQMDNNTIGVNVFKDSENQLLVGNKKVGDQYRFTIEKLANVL
ncbi:hypothetical protein [Tenacibaculum aiptasiae]|uniref:hypothetical protein n=1 Tax=Tenacibaculum aiptasiae TaxID=426481 RepID=UPI003B5C2672